MLKGKSVEFVSAMSDIPFTPLDIAQPAFQDLIHGLATGQWQAFLDRLTDDFVFWFPAAPFQGENIGKPRAAEFFHYISQEFNRSLIITPEQITYSDSTVVFDLRTENPTANPPVTGRAAISFDIRDDRICALRQYLLLFR